MTENSSDIEKRLEMCCAVLKQFSWLTNAYILDFFVENYWEQLLKSWSNFVDRISLEALANVLDVNKPILCQDTVVPLSLICLRLLLKNLSLPRNCIAKETDNTTNFYADKRLMNLFWKNVKVKKRHEIMEMAKLCHKTATECNCFYIVDVGSGLGHLSRILGYGYKFNVLSIEASENFSLQAKRLDFNFKKSALKYLENIGKVRYLNRRIERDINGDEILESFRDLFGLKENISFGLVGLHPCGDLAALLLKLYRDSDNIKFINIASCCYMKLATPSSSLDDSFPVSTYCKKGKVKLSYNDREVACHAIEMYIDKLKLSQHQELKIHTYRAVLEKIIVTQWPQLRHSQLSNIKFKQGLSFEEYCRRAVLKLGVHIKSEVFKSENVCKNLKQWCRVVKFYTLRLMLAPLIETIILLDRFLYLEETGGKNEIVVSFQPRISPRNQILNGIKTM